jgi:glycosyltransferase involved in cell wall biosynthesis
MTQLIPLPRPGQRRVVFLNWRDLGSPLGGGSERYLHQVAAGLVGRGDVVTVRTAHYPGAARSDVLDGVRYLRRGTANTVFPTALADLAAGRLGPADVVVDCQNGVPFWSRTVTRRPVVVLVHHVHREQWRVAVGGAAARLGWALESRVAPAAYRGCQYVAVSESTRTELTALGVHPARIAVVHNGVSPRPPTAAVRGSAPQLTVLSRLVPHKQLEHALEVTARLQARWPDLRLILVGSGYWAPTILRRAEELGVAGRVRLLGHVDEQTKHEELARSWVHLCPSVKEGWGLAIQEAAQHGVPTVAYRSAGGTVESVLDGRTGLLADDREDLARATERLLADELLRSRLGAAAQRRVAEFTWERTTAAFSDVLDAVLAGRRLAGPADQLPPTVDRRGRGPALSAHPVVGPGEQRLLHGSHVRGVLPGDLDDTDR